MSNPLIRDCNQYVILIPGKKEEFLTAEETLQWLIKQLESMESQPEDLENQPCIESAAKHLLNTACELEIQSGIKIQWFAIRLNPQEI